MPSVDFPAEGRKTFALPGAIGTGTATLAVPDPGAWYIAALTFRVVTDATVATRTPVITVLDGSSIPMAVASGGFGITASLTTDYSYAAGLYEWDFAGSLFASGPAPQVPLLPGDTVSLSLSAGVAGDAISRVRLSLAPLAVTR